MKRPTAIPIDKINPAPAGVRPPRALAVTAAKLQSEFVESHSETPTPAADVVPPRRASWLVRLLLAMAALLVSLAIGLGLNALINGLFAAAPWLGWVGVAVVALFLIALVALLVREIRAVSRLRDLDHLRRRASETLTTDLIKDARPILAELKSIYSPRPDLARALATLDVGEAQIFDGGALVRFGERTLMAQLDARARGLTAAAARRVALVTAISPRALVDIAYVAWESIRLGGAIARLYGARPGLWGTWRLIGSILGHLAVTGGLLLTDGVVEQLVGQGLAARLSQRLGEGVVNGLMTVRVGIAAMRVVRPLPFATEPAPMVRDYLPELMNVVKGKDET